MLEAKFFKLRKIFNNSKLIMYKYTMYEMYGQYAFDIWIYFMYT